MANDAHLKILEKGVSAWNNWRMENPGLRPELTESNLLGVLTEANLTEANLTGANLTLANLSSADLERTNLTNSLLHVTIFGNVDLSEARGLETVRHAGPSTIGIDSIFRSKGKISENFLRGAGCDSPELRAPLK